jgi:hypothetical protein
MNDDTHEFSRPITQVPGFAPVDSYLTGAWEALGSAAPILVALAQISSQAMVDRPQVPKLEALKPEARTILYAARERGILEIKGLRTPFEAPSRLVAVYVEEDDERKIAFRDATDPEVTVQFLEGFRELCFYGLVIHHLHGDFSLSSDGFQLARQIKFEDVKEWLEKGTEFGLHD